MDPELQLWRDAKRIFDRLANFPVERRQARLERMRIGAPVRERLLELFAAQQRPPGLLESPLLANASANSLIGRRLGPWVLEAELGHGGSAVVFRASADHDGTVRHAAVKLLTLGSLARTGWERFRQEQRILARLNHPHIAQMFDVGRAADGTPWLAMALIEGVPIDEWCRSRALPPRAIVRLLLDVCDAVAYAHRSLVIHRDIKPSNVLVDLHGHVRLLDFGIGRLLDDESAATETQWRVLTPQYAAPEQFAGALPSTSMDVYGLGALLYRLLSGRAPRETLTPGDAPPTAPSHVVDAQGRHLPAALRRELRGDLDAIVLQAMAQRPDERYASVTQLAADLRHWLQREPVAARRAGIGYRLRRFAQRHRVGVAATALIAITLAAGVVATLTQAERARRQAELATTTRDFLVSLFQGASPKRIGGPMLDARELLAAGVQRINSELAGEPALRGELLLVVGTIHSELSDFATASSELSEAAKLADLPDAPPGLRGRVEYQLGMTALRDTKYRDAVEHFDRVIGLDPPGNRERRANLVYTYISRAESRQMLGDAPAALRDIETAASLETDLTPAVPRRSAQIRTVRGKVLRALGRLAEARADILDALALIGAPSPGDYPLLSALGQVDMELGENKEAEDADRKALDLAQQAYPTDNLNITGPMQNLGALYLKIGRFADAEPLLQRALEIRRRLGKDKRNLGGPLSNLGSLLFYRGRYGEAAAALEEGYAAASATFSAHDPHALLVEATLLRVRAAQRDSAETARLSADLLAGVQSAEARNEHSPLMLEVIAILARQQIDEDHPDAALTLLDRSSAFVARGEHSPPDQAIRDALRVAALTALSRQQEAAPLAAQLAAQVPTLRGLGLAERGEVLAILARSALARGDRARSRAFLAQARAIPTNTSYAVWLETMLHDIELLLDKTATR
jgi:serine/threonine-protein kinase